jgi:hypothetical protein
MLKTHPLPVLVLNRLFPVYLVEPWYLDKLALGVDEVVAWLFGFAARGQLQLVLHAEFDP